MTPPAQAPDRIDPERARELITGSIAWAVQQYCAGFIRALAEGRDDEPDE